MRAAGRGVRRGRRGRRRGRTVKLSLISKAALATAGLVPVVIAGGAALNRVLTRIQPTGEDASMVGKIELGAAQFANELAVGFGISAPFPSLMVQGDSGANYTVNLTTATPSGAYLKTTAVATGVVVADAIRSWILNFATRRGGRAARWFGQTLTTGR